MFRGRIFEAAGSDCQPEEEWPTANSVSPSGSRQDLKQAHPPHRAVAHRQAQVFSPSDRQARLAWIGSARDALGGAGAGCDSDAGGLKRRRGVISDVAVASCAGLSSRGSFAAARGGISTGPDAPRSGTFDRDVCGDTISPMPRWRAVLVCPVRAHPLRPSVTSPKARSVPAGP